MDYDDLGPSIEILDSTRAPVEPIVVHRIFRFTVRIVSYCFNYIPSGRPLPTINDLS